MVRYSKNLTTDASGVATFVLPETGLTVDIQPRTAGEYAHSIVVAGDGKTTTVTFRKFKPAGLGITLGTLLTTSIFEDSPGTVNFDVVGTAQTP